MDLNFSGAINHGIDHQFATSANTSFSSSQGKDVLQKFTLYETRARYYMVGTDKRKKYWRILKIDRMEPCDLTVVQDPIVYTESQCKSLLNQLDVGNRSTGGLQVVTKCYGIVGFIRFLEPWYVIVITKRRQLGSICDHIIYGVGASQLITIPHSSVQSDTANSRIEQRYRKLLSGVDLTKDFYYSYTYPIMYTLQRNAARNEGAAFADSAGQDWYKNMFVWNAFLTRPIREIIQENPWTVALCHGFFQQAKLSLLGRVFVIILISRRSRHFAGTRYLKRGVNDHGRVANEVETEQIVLDEDSGAGGIPPQMTAVTQLRGSIPLYWSQDVSRLNAKPDIQLHKFDPMYTSTRLHFEDLEERYGNPIIILNLIKTFENHPREMILRREFSKAATYLNVLRPPEKQLMFIHWDYHKFSKSKTAKSHVLTVLEDLSSHCLDIVGLFYSGKPSIRAKKWARLQRITALRHNPKATEARSSSVLGRTSSLTSSSSHQSTQFNHLDSLLTERDEEEPLSPPSMAHESVSTRPTSLGMSLMNVDQDSDRVPRYQVGILRTNCIDCLDRTNVAQFAFGKAALGRQLKLLGLNDEETLEADSGVTKVLMEMYQSMGDALAMQYGGSAAHNTVFHSRSGLWEAAAKSREFFNSIQRYYNNAYTDAEKQDAINLFLGHFQPEEDKPHLWDLGTASHSISGDSENSDVLQTIEIDSMSPETSLHAPHGGLPSSRPFPLRLVMLSLPKASEGETLKESQRVKLTSFDKLSRKSRETDLKNVRLHGEAGTSRGLPSLSSELELILESPEWLFGKKKKQKEEVSSMWQEASRQAPTEYPKELGVGNSLVNLADDFSILPTREEEAFYQRYISNTASESDDWYGTNLLHGSVDDSEANEFYLQFYQGAHAIDLSWGEHSAAVLESAFGLDNNPVRERRVAEAMEASLQLPNVIGQDL